MLWLVETCVWIRPSKPLSYKKTIIAQWSKHENSKCLRGNFKHVRLCCFYFTKTRGNVARVKIRPSKHGNHEVIVWCSVMSHIFFGCHAKSICFENTLIINWNYLSLNVRDWGIFHKLQSIFNSSNTQGCKSVFLPLYPVPY